MSNTNSIQETIDAMKQFDSCFYLYNRLYDTKALTFLKLGELWGFSNRNAGERKTITKSKYKKEEE